MKLNKPYLTDLTKEAWLLQRKNFITATEASILMGVNPYTTPSKLLREKPQPPKEIVGDNLDRGLENEEAVLKAASAWLGGTLVESQGFYANPDTRISATPDAILSDGRLIEAKCTGMTNLNRWADYPPTYYIMQCQVQMYVTGAVENYLHVRFFYDWPSKECSPGADRMYKITYSADIMNICIDKVAEFWYSLEKGIKMLNNKEESLRNEELLKATCENFKGHVIMQKFEIDAVQLSIIRQTCIKAAARICRDLPTNSVVEFAKLIEEEIYITISKGCEDTSRNFLIQIGAAVKAYAEGNHSKNRTIADLKKFVIQSLKFITRKE